MSHLKQREFCETIRRLAPMRFKDAKVLDVGCQDINGNNRYLFDGGTYLGCDVFAGKNVDHVGPCWTVPLELGPFSVVISTEMLEHDSTWKRSIAAMEERVAPGGLLLITCAGPGRPVHHTPPGGYYKNLTPADLLGALNKKLWERIETLVETTHHDTYLWAVKHP